jgi:hypothetical protein
MGTKTGNGAKEMMEVEDQLCDEMREEYRKRLQRRMQERLETKERGLPEAQRLKKNASSRCTSKASSGTSPSKRSRDIAPC